MRLSAIFLTLLISANSAGASLASDCAVFSVCEGKRCIHVPGQFVQKFKSPPGDVGETDFKHGRAHFFSNFKEVVPAIKAGKVSRDVRYVVWPDDIGRGGYWMDAVVYAVKWLGWDGDKPSLSKTTSLMACEIGYR